MSLLCLSHLSDWYQILEEPTYEDLEGLKYVSGILTMFGGEKIGCSS
jgi:hypothetical protein